MWTGLRWNDGRGRHGGRDEEETKQTPRNYRISGPSARDAGDPFKWLKDRYVVSLKLMWVRHDASVPGYMFVCVMGLMLLRYLQWEARASGSL